MEDRYDLIKARQGIAPDLPDEEITSDIWGLPESERPVPVVLFVDEVAELFLTATRKDEERRDEMVTQLIRLAQLGRAADHVEDVGVHEEVLAEIAVRADAELAHPAHGRLRHRSHTRYARLGWLVPRCTSAGLCHQPKSFAALASTAASSSA